MRDAIDELPDFVKDELDRNVAVIVADDGASPERYGHPKLGELLGPYVGWTASRPTEDARTILFRDTLTRSFEDPEELRRSSPGRWNLRLPTTPAPMSGASRISASEQRLKLQMDSERKKPCDLQGF